jgi:DNA-directed RNA polymerase delta subunit
MSKLSMKDAAVEILTNASAPLSFADLWSAVQSQLVMSPEEARSKISTFYTHISLDDRLFMLSGNFWDLRIRHSSDELIMDMYLDDIEVDDEELEDSELTDEDGSDLNAYDDRGEEAGEFGITD